MAAAAVCCVKTETLVKIDSLERYIATTIPFSPSQLDINLTFFFSLSLAILSQDDHKAFRRQLEDKRPIVESNLLSGRQYVASEPPVSDTSDSEGLLLSSLLLEIDIEQETNSHMLFSSVHATALDADSRFLSAEEQSRELTRSIRRELTKLTEQWNHLINRSDTWKHRLDDLMTVSVDFSFTICVF